MAGGRVATQLEGRLRAARVENELHLGANILEGEVARLLGKGLGWVGVQLRRVDALEAHTVDDASGELYVYSIAVDDLHHTHRLGELRRWQIVLHVGRRLVGFARDDAAGSQGD